MKNAMRVMHIISKKIDEHEGASAIIVSHDMHLATTFADIIIKIRKEIRHKQHCDDEAYGVIDDNCVFRPDFSRERWACGNVVFETDAFEEYLRKK